MKISKFILALLVSFPFLPRVHAQTDPGSTNANSTNVTYAILSRDANSRQWVKVLSQTNAAGQVTTTTNRAYTELASGLCFLQDGNWVDSDQTISVVPDGGSATQARHQVHFAGNANTPGGAIHLVAPDGKVVAFTYDCTNALILNNDFSWASYLGIGYQWGSSSLPFASVFGNKIGKGLTFHARMNYTESFGWFFKQNQYLNGTNIVPPFFEPAASEAHVSN
jgi:hypothetical protein